MNAPFDPACCADPTTGSVATDSPLSTPLIALAGNPNSGKSTLFNALTGARRAVGNWPGTTVEVGRGATALRDGREVRILDLPGAYSLDADSPDEALTRELLFTGTAPDLVVVVVDATSLERGLFLVSQLREHHRRVVIALTMLDVARRRGLTVDVAALAGVVGMPVVPVDPRRREGIADVRAVATAAIRAEESPLLSFGSAVSGHDPLPGEEERFAWIQRAVVAAVHRETGHRRTWSDRIDAIATAPVLGMVVFLAVMWLVFEITTTVAAPLQEWLDTLVMGPISETVASGFGAIGLGGSVLSGFVVDGLIAGVGTLLTFIPLMALMFILLALLEDSGYLARAAVVTDRLMRRIGLPGRAFLPLVVGFGCNVPAIAAVRVLGDARHRLLTSLLVPFTSCSARLTVYVLIATAFFGNQAGTVVFGLYVLSILLVIGVGFALRSTLLRTVGSEPLIIDLPPYHRPTLRLVSAVTWQRLRGFLATASGIIVATVTAVWALSSIPAAPGYSFAEVPVQDSVYGKVAEVVAPVFDPAGFGDWHATSALITGFVAKEAVISSWAQTYSLDEPTDPTNPGTLGNQVHASFQESSGGHGTAAALAFLVFLLAYTPCMATVAAQRREIGTRWTLTGIAIQLAVAYALAVIVFQVLRTLGTS